ncbi:MAG: phosphatidylserine decarboxylase [Alphaproteobacteria bacterium]|nr:MAG: phosphatidylserine decarboxylase [Alphaproteobacteria bacterium]
MRDTNEHSLLATIGRAFVPIHPDGYKFIAAFALATLLLFWIAEPLGWLGVLATGWCAYFFRDPERATPVRAGLVMSPADGRVSAIETVTPPDDLDLGGEERVRISVFLSVFDVHINRAPVTGKIVKAVYIPGLFLNAELDKASEENERNCLTFEMEDGTRIGCVQIAGLVARRIVTFVGEGHSLAAGERFGLIRFGSRVDVYLPPGVNPLVAVGQTAIGGETVLADLKSKEGPREARLH